ncbi:MAG: prepilin-type N-terminal cleavage/methylation domain-containing protein [Rickettsiales bacterium]|jgi:prepilin-type N-terminal cleavage/methylation domain-containing protein
MKNNFRLGFSLLEVSVVLLIIGILLASVSAGKSMIRTSRITSSQSLTASSPVSAVEGLAIWLETVSVASLSSDDTYDSQTISSGWQNLTNYFTPASFIVNGPVYNESSINGLPSVTFDGNNTVNIRPSLQHITGTNFSIFIVEERSDDTGILIDSNNLVVEYDANNFQIEKNGTQVVNVAAPAGPTINYISFASSAIGSAPEGLAYYRNKGVFFNSTNQTITPTTTASDDESIPSIVSATLGAGSGGFQGDISELIVYNNSLTMVELNEILDYLSSKYRITLERE